MNLKLFKIRIKTLKQTSELLLTQSEAVVGRSADCDVPIEAVGISRKHLKVEIKDGELHFTDLASTNGTYYQGVKVKPNLPVSYFGGVIYLGPASDGNVIEFLEESAVKERTGTFSKVAEVARTEPPSYAESQVEVGEKEHVDLSAVIEKSKLLEDSPVSLESSKVMNRVLDVETQQLKDAVQKLRRQQEEAEAERRHAEIKKHEVEVELRDLRREVESLESKVSSLRDHYDQAKAELARDEEALAQSVSELNQKRDTVRQQEREVSDLLDQLEQKKLASAEKLDAIVRSHELEKADHERKHQNEIAQLETKWSRELQELKEAHQRQLSEEKKQHDDLMKELHDDLGRRQSEVKAQWETCEQDFEKMKSGLSRQEAELRSDFEAKEKKFRLQLEALSAEIDLKRAQENKLIEQCKTEFVIADRELKKVQEELKSEQDELKRSRLAGAEQLERVKKLKAEEEQHQLRLAKLQEEQQKSKEAIEQKKAVLAQLEIEVTEQQKRIKAEWEQARQKQEALVASMIAEGRSSLEAERKQKEESWSDFERRARESLDQELERKRGEVMGEVERRRLEAESRQQQELEKWNHHMDEKKRSEAEALSLWLAEEKMKVQSKLTGDLDSFVQSVTSRALSQVQQNPQFAGMIHEFHSKFSQDLKSALTGTGEFVAQFNPDRGKNARSFWAKSAASVAAGVALVLAIQHGPGYVERAYRAKVASKDDGAASEWVRKLQKEREERLALKLETRDEFQSSYSENAVYNEGYLEMKLDQGLQSAWIRELNALMTGEKAMGMDEQAVVEFVRIEHSLFMDLRESRSKMNALNQEEIMKQMRERAEQAKLELIAVLREKTLPASDRARLTSAEQKFRTIREHERHFYSLAKAQKIQLDSANRLPAQSSSETDSNSR